MVSTLNTGSSGSVVGSNAKVEAFVSSTGAGTLSCASLLPPLHPAISAVAIISKLINLVFIFFVFNVSVVFPIPQS